MADCNKLWDPDSQLYAQPFLPKGLSADTSAAYGLMAFIGDNPRLKLVLTGTFPKSSYMSLQIYRGRFQGPEGVGPALSDYMIAADPGGKNPYQTHDLNDAGQFKIEITPDPSAEGSARLNTIWYDPNPSPIHSRLISAFYRVYQPAGGKLSFGDLPAIEARDYQTDAVIQCPVYQRLDWYLDLPDDIVFVLNNFFPLRLKPLQFEIKKSSAGTNQDAVYAFSFKNIPVGQVTVVSFRAPAIHFSSPDPAAGSAVRYWSICPIYWPMLKTLNGVACEWDKPGEREITVVFGPNKHNVRAKAADLGAYFLSDDRTKDEQVVGFIVRNVLPTAAFKQQMFQGGYLPRGRDMSELEFLHLTPNDLPLQA